MITSADKIALQAMMRREIEAHARGPQFNSHQTPRGTSQGRIARYISSRLPLNPRELDEFALLVNEQPVPLMYLGGKWRMLGTPPLVTSFPTELFDGMVVNYVADSSNGVQWLLRYRAAGSASYPWEFIGGSPLTADVDTQESTSSTTLTDLATTGPTVTVPLGGDYDISFGCAISGITSADAMMSFAVGGVSAAVADGAKTFNATGIAVSVARERRKTGVAAGANIRAKYGTTFGTGTGSYQYRWIKATPVRVG